MVDKKLSLSVILTISIISFSVQASSKYNEPDNDDMNERHHNSFLALELHNTMNSITNTSHPYLYNAIQATTDEQINEYFGDDVNRQDLLDLNHANNSGKHNWN